MPLDLNFVMLILLNYGMVITLSFMAFSCNILWRRTSSYGGSVPVRMMNTYQKVVLGETSTLNHDEMWDRNIVVYLAILNGISCEKSKLAFCRRGVVSD